MMRSMLMDRLAGIESALATVQKTLDALTSRGHHEAAYELARLQYTASIRSSWPGNLSKLVGTLERIAHDETLVLSKDERAELEKAADVFRVAIDS